MGCCRFLYDGKIARHFTGGLIKLEYKSSLTDNRGGDSIRFVKIVEAVFGPTLLNVLIYHQGTLSQLPCRAASIFRREVAFLFHPDLSRKDRSGSASRVCHHTDNEVYMNNRISLCILNNPPI